MVDYKTSRPLSGKSVDEFMEREVDLYRPQLLAYKEMVANYFKVDPRSVRIIALLHRIATQAELNCRFLFLRVTYPLISWPYRKDGLPKSGLTTKMVKNRVTRWVKSSFERLSGSK